MRKRFRVNLFVLAIVVFECGLFVFAQDTLTQAPMPISAETAESLLLQHDKPRYPPIAYATRVSGTVVLDAEISDTGTVTDLQVVSGPPLLQQAALDSAKNWRYKPYEINGMPASVKTTIKVVFAWDESQNPHPPTAAPPVYPKTPSASATDRPKDKLAAVAGPLLTAQANPPAARPTFCKESFFSQIEGDPKLNKLAAQGTASEIGKAFTEWGKEGKSKREGTIELLVSYGRVDVLKEAVIAYRLNDEDVSAGLTASMACVVKDAFDFFLHDSNFNSKEAPILSSQDWPLRGRPTLATMIGNLLENSSASAETFLSMAVEREDPFTTRLLIERGADPNFQTSTVGPIESVRTSNGHFEYTKTFGMIYGPTPLFCAIAAADSDLVSLLISRGADPRKKAMARTLMKGSVEVLSPIDFAMERQTAFHSLLQPGSLRMTEEIAVVVSSKELQLQKIIVLLQAAIDTRK